MRLGVYLFALASIAAGILDLIWREFEPAHQPVRAFGDHIPGVTLLAFLGAICLIAGGLALFTPKFTRAGCIVWGIVYLAFSLCYIPRFFTAPRILGYHVWLFIGLCAGFAMNFILAAAALLIYSCTPTRNSSWPTILRGCRWVFGISSILFGLVHISRSETVTPMIPAWMPFSIEFWTYFTGVAFILAGLAILSRTLDVLAARLLALMLLLFSVLVLLPMIFTTPMTTSHGVATPTISPPLPLSGFLPPPSPPRPTKFAQHGSPRRGAALFTLSIEGRHELPSPVLTL